MADTERQSNSKMILHRLDVESKIITSDVLSEDREIWIHTPQQAKVDKSKSFPLILVLDAYLNFPLTLGIYDQATVRPYTTLPEAYIVGLVNSHRILNFTPTVVVDKEQEYSEENTGGLNLFISFLQQELMPFLDQYLRLNQQKILFGHSLAGLVGIELFFKHSSLFSTYICLDPSLWWDNEYYLKKEVSVPGHYAADLLLYMCGDKQKNDYRSKEFDVEETFKKSLSPDSTLVLKWYPDENHFSIVPRALPVAFNWLYHKFSVLDHPSES